MRRLDRVGGRLLPVIRRRGGEVRRSAATAETSTLVPGRGRQFRSGRLLAGRVGLGALSLVLGLTAWTLAAQFSVEAELLPAPYEVLQTFWERLSDGRLMPHVWASLFRVLVGFGLGVAVAIPAGFLMGWYAWARGMLEPWVQFFRTVPPLALIPLVILFLGIGESSKIFLIFLASFLACVIATFQGVRNVDKTLINAARVLGSNDRSLFLHVIVPASFPYILVGMRVALGSAWATLVAAELIAATQGLGQMIQNASQFFDTETVIVGIVLIGVLGFAMDRAVLYLERRLTGWQERRED